VGHGVIHLAGLRINIGKVVIVGGHFLVAVGIFLRRFRGGAQVNRLLVSGCGLFVALLFLLGISLLRSRHAIGIAKFEPDQIPRSVNLVGFIQGGDCGLVVASIGSRTGGFEFVVERAHDLVGCCGLGLGL